MPKELIIVDQCCSWERTIYNLFEKVLCDSSIGFGNHLGGLIDEVIDFVKKECPEVTLDPDASWLENYIYKLYGGTPCVAESLANRILDCRMYLLAYHACRPTDIKSYYEEGLIPLNEKYIRDYFNQKDYPSITEEKLASALKCIKDDGTRFGRTYFVINPEIICKRDSHYLKRGSECLSIIARECHVQLKADARPTFFVCDVPVKSIPSECLEEISALMLNIMFMRILKREVDWNELYYGFYIEEKLSKDNMTDHFYPAID